MFGGGSGGRPGFFSLAAWFLLLPAEECLRSSNGYLSGRERDMSQRPPKRPFSYQNAAVFLVMYCAWVRMSFRHLLTPTM